MRRKTKYTPPPDTRILLVRTILHTAKGLACQELRIQSIIGIDKEGLAGFQYFCISEDSHKIILLSSNTQTIPREHLLLQLRGVVKQLHGYMAQGVSAALRHLSGNESSIHKTRTVQQSISLKRYS